MNDSNPYESPATRSPAVRSWSRIDFLLVGLWIAIPVGVVLARQWLLPIYEDFGVNLPTLTRILLHFYASVPLSYLCILVLTGILLIPHGKLRRVVLVLAWALGIFVALFCLLAHAIPLIRLIEGLDG